MADYTWSTRSDWDAAQAREGIVSRSIGDRTGDTIQQGWDPQHPPVDSGLSYWTLDESSGTLVDSLGGNDGTNRGGSRDVTGLLGSTAINLDGSSDYIEVEDSADFDDLSGLTIALWVKFDDFGQYNSLAGKGDLGSDGGSFLFELINDDEPTLYIEDYSTYDDTTTSALSTGTWYHLAVTWSEGEGATFYVDGESVGGGSSTDRSMPNTSGSLTFGADVPYDSYTDGTIDEPMVFDRELSSSEIDTLYSASQSASLTTATVSDDAAAETLDVTASVPADASVTATVRQDTSVNGGSDYSDQVAVLDGTNTYSLSGFVSEAGADYWVEFDFSTTNVETTATVSSATLSTAGYSHLFVASFPVGDETYDIPVYDTSNVNPDSIRFRDTSDGTVGAARIVNHEEARAIVRHPADGRLGLETVNRDGGDGDNGDGGDGGGDGGITTGTTVNLPGDDESKSVSALQGVGINPNRELEGVRAGISSDAAGYTTAHLYDADTNTMLAEVDVSDYTTGDTVDLLAPSSSSLSAGTTYYVLLSADGDSYTRGRAPASYPYTSADVDVTSGPYSLSSTSDSYRYNYDQITALVSE